ncbi:MAG: lamin tail domain-containing protein [Anaerolineae bacterium]|nr:lamin tail domain-containing protein [Anaerolineae bacterium]
MLRKQSPKQDFRRLITLAIALVIPALVAACGSDDTPARATPTRAPTPTTHAQATAVPTAPLPTATPTASAAPATPNAMPGGAVAAQLTNVVDGDTIDVLIDGQTERVRYIGIDTPERGDPGYQAATDANAALLGSGQLQLVADTSDRDRYDRLLRYVYTGENYMVNVGLVAGGWAQPVEYPPDTAHAAEFLTLTREAAAAGLGFWGNADPDDVMPYAITTVPSANIRSGPGTAFDTTANVPADTPLTVFGRTPEADWLQVRTPDRSGGWISTGLVALNIVASQVVVAEDIPVAPGVALAEQRLPAELQVQVSVGGTVMIIGVDADGQDETVTVRNTMDRPIDMSGWSIQSYGGRTCQPVPEQVFRFPASFVLDPDATVLIHSGPQASANPPVDLMWTNENIWNNSNDRGDLIDRDGEIISTWTYGDCQ